MKSFMLCMIIGYSLTAAAQANSAAVGNGKRTYENSCVRCHGYDGTLGKWGAKNLQASKLTDERFYQVIANGKWIMPSWKKVLTEAEIAAVIIYIKTLRSRRL